MSRLSYFAECAPLKINKNQKKENNYCQNYGENHFLPGTGIAFCKMSKS